MYADVPLSSLQENNLFPYILESIYGVNNLDLLPLPFCLVFPRILRTVLSSSAALPILVMVRPGLTGAMDTDGVRLCGLLFSNLLASAVAFELALELAVLFVLRRISKTCLYNKNNNH